MMCVLLDLLQHQRTDFPANVAGWCSDQTHLEETVADAGTAAIGFQACPPIPVLVLEVDRTNVLLA